MRHRVKRHEEVMELIRHPPPGVAVVDVSPPEDFVIGRFSRDRGRLLEGYHMGFDTAEDAMTRWHNLKPAVSPARDSARSS